MAIARGAGTEIIRSAHFEDIDSTARALIYGVQHHVYTVLSVIMYANAVNAAGDFGQLYLLGYDTTAGTTAQNIYILNHDFNLYDTFVWNDKFSFNGTEPTDFGSPPLSTVAEQDLIADQATATSQSLQCISAAATDNFHVIITYIDQNNA